MKIRLHPEAAKELLEAITYYESASEGLGTSFHKEYKAACFRIQTYPSAWTSLSKTTRRALLARFPFGIIYTKEGEHILVIAVAHLHRRPGYWSDR